MFAQIGLSLGGLPPSLPSYSSLLSVVLGKLKLMTPNHAQSEYVTEYLEDVDDCFSLKLRAEYKAGAGPPVERQHAAAGVGQGSVRAVGGGRAHDVGREPEAVPAAQRLGQVDGVSAVARRAQRRRQRMQPVGVADRGHHRVALPAERRQGLDLSDAPVPASSPHLRAQRRDDGDHKEAKQPQKWWEFQFQDKNMKRSKMEFAQREKEEKKRQDTNRKQCDSASIWWAAATATSSCTTTRCAASWSYRRCAKSRRSSSAASRSTWASSTRTTSAASPTSTRPRVGQQKQAQVVAAQLTKQATQDQQERVEQAT